MNHYKNNIQGYSILMILLFLFFFPSNAFPEEIPEDRDLATIQDPSKAFTKLSKKVMPAVVFIKVEMLIDSQ